MEKQRLNELKQLQKIAGILKEEDFDLPDESPFDNANKGKWMSNLDVDLDGIEIYNDGENRLFIIFDKDTGVVSVINDWNGEDFDEVWSTEDIRPTLLNSLNDLHEDFELPDESPFDNPHKSRIKEAFREAKIDLDKPVTYIYTSGRSTDDPVTVLGSILLQELEAQAEEEDPLDYDEDELINFEINPTQGKGELLGDDDPFAEAVEGLKCKLNLYFSDSALYEIWQ